MTERTGTSGPRMATPVAFWMTIIGLDLRSPTPDQGRKNIDSPGPNAHTPPALLTNSPATAPGSTTLTDTPEVAATGAGAVAREPVELDDHVTDLGPAEIELPAEDEPSPYSGPECEQHEIARATSAMEARFTNPVERNGYFAALQDILDVAVLRHVLDRVLNLRLGAAQEPLSIFQALVARVQTSINDVHGHVYSGFSRPV